MRPHSPDHLKPTGKIASLIERDFNSFEKFKDEFTNKAMGQFGSGWAWLAQDPSTKKLQIVTTSNGRILFFNLLINLLYSWHSFD